MRSASQPPPQFQEFGTNGRDINPLRDRIKKDSPSATYAPPAYEKHRTTSADSQEITLGYNATRVSMVEDMLMSLNTLPDAQGPFPHQAPLQSSFAPDGQTFSTSFLDRAKSSHRRAKSSLATTDSTSTVGAHPLGDASHVRNTTLTQADFARKDSAATMSSEARRDITPRAILHKAKASISSAPQKPADSSRKSSAISLAVSGENSRSHSPARAFAESDASDRESRRRSRSFNVPASSVLNRSRPVPAEYYDFTGASNSSSRPNLRKSTSNPNHFQSRMREDFPPDLPSDRLFPPTSYLAQFDADRLSSRAASSTYMGSESTVGGLSSKDVSSNMLASSNAVSVGLKTPCSEPPKQQAKPKYRPGFFKRMFAPSKAQAAESKAPQLPPLHVDTKQPSRAARSEPDSGGALPSPLTPADPPVASPAEADSQAKAAPPQKLREKSSFFRRRRKTVNEKDSAAVSREESPSAKNSSRPSTSSLRQAMDPYMVHDPMPQNVDFEQLLLNKANDAQPASALPFQSRAAKPGAPAVHDTPGASDGQQPTQIRPLTSTSSAVKADSTRTDGDASVASTPASKLSRPATSPTAPGRDEPPQPSPQVVLTPRQPKKAPPPPPLDVSASKRDTRSRWQLSSNQSRSNSEKGSTRVAPADDESVEQTPVRPPNTRAVASENSLGTTEDYISAKSIPVVQADDQDDDVVSPLPDDPGQSTPWSAREFERAQRIWDAQNDPAIRGQGMTELGEPGEGGDRLRVAFMSFFDFTGLNILLALRDLCGRMILKGETQQMDRVVAAFADRWCECNPYHGFKCEDVVHTVAYSLLLLNTDLHIVEHNEKMTQRQFVRNTTPTLRRIAEAELADPNATLKPNRPARRIPAPWSDGRNSPMDSPELGVVFDKENLSPLPSSLSKRPISSVPSVNMASPTPYGIHSVDTSEMLVNSPHEGSMKQWESTVETVLKEFYTSIRQLRLPLHGGSELSEQPSSNNLSVVSSIMRRTGSVISKTPSEQSRGRVPDIKPAGSRWSSKNRSKPRPYPSSTLASSRTGSHTSLDEHSPWSPSASSTWSRSYGHTQTSMSTDSLASRFAPGADPGYQQSIGFANALSHAIIREENAGDDATLNEDALLEDQTLELAGAPWAKEGIVHHKHHLEMVDKKAKDRNWSECFAVVNKGVFKLFSFNKSKSSSRNAKTPKGAVVGGGNWLDNANEVGHFMLRQTIANALPPPGYSKSRPFVFALSLPNGAVHLFQVGTPEIAREFVSTANYWSARLSKEPLVGGVSSIEYGWGESVINTALLSSDSASSQSRGTPAAPPSSYHLPRTSSSMSGANASAGRSRHSPSPSFSMSPAPSSRPSLHESLRSSLDAASRPVRSRLPADRIALGEWTPPQQSTMASTLTEQAQLEALTKYVRSVEGELGRHNELRQAMALAFTPKSVNAQRALSNWERKSSYLLREIVKFRTYVDVLQHAAAEAKRVKGEEAAAATESNSAPLDVAAEKKKIESIRGRIRKVESADSYDSEPEDEDLPEETREALRAARMKQQQQRA